ncbi:MAG TPA: hypothetical protein VGE15_06595 [Sphingobacteriaceae bacterium]
MTKLDHKRLLDATPVALVVTDEKGDVKFLNKQGSSLLGTAPDLTSPLNLCTFFDKKLIDYDQKPPHLSFEVLLDIYHHSPNQWLVNSEGVRTYVHLELDSFSEDSGSSYIWTLTPVNRKNLAYDIKERIKEQVAVVKVMEAFFESADLPTALKRSLLAIQQGWQFPYATCVRVRLQDGQEFQTEDFLITDWLLTERIVTSDKELGTIEVCYSVEIPAYEDGSVFLQEEVRLIKLLAKLLGILIDHWESAEKIKANGMLLKKITSHVPANTYQFEIFPDGSTRILFMNKGTEVYNHPLETAHIEQEPAKLFETLHDSDRTKFRAAMREAYHTRDFLSIQYRISLGDMIRWRWLKAVPEISHDGKIIWYGASQDITLLIEYISSVEQILFDISHIIRSPLASILGISKYIKDTDLKTEEMREITKNLLTISEELDFYIQQLNSSYEKKRQLDYDYQVDFSPFVDNRDDFFGRKSS